MTLQSFFKHFLTEGDRILVSQVSPLKDQGGYAIATNYGSLIARIVFQPMEEAARLYFARTPLATSPTPSTPSPMTRGSAVAEEDNSAPLILPLLLRLSSHLLLLLPALGPPYIPTLLSLLLPSRSGWSSARLQTPTKILTLYTLYLPLLSLNGLLEAFFASTASPRDLAAQSRSMVGWTAMFVGFVWLWSRGLGWDEPERALVIGNCLGMMGRIGWTVRYAKRRFREVGRRLSVWEMVPGRWAVMVCVGSSVVARLSQARLSSKPPWKEIGMHFGLGGVLGIICLAAWSVFFLCDSFDYAEFRLTAWLSILAAFSRKGQTSGKSPLRSGERKIDDSFIML
jgi:oligosaccharide translocation protein RFT1